MGKSFWALNYVLRFPRVREVILAGVAEEVVDLMIDEGVDQEVLDAMGDQVGSDGMIEEVVASEEEAVDQVGGLDREEVQIDMVVEVDLRVVQDAISVVHRVDIVRVVQAQEVGEIDFVHVAHKEDADSKLHIQIHT
jgi:hypothetical protein